jgi:Na+-translocating ferredoxin:NAD+ oxidoreductase subunit B
MLSVAIITLIALVLGALLGAAAARLKDDSDALVNKVHELLPHTQCGQCGFAGCRPYAQALAQRSAAITLCPPGGAGLVKHLADLLGVDQPPAASSDQPMARVAFIDEQRCVGCALCLDACPVDAIVGAARQMHTVVAALCTGCELCLAPCPVDCIDMRASNDARPDWLGVSTNATLTRLAA